MTTTPVEALRRAGRALGLTRGKPTEKQKRAWSGEADFLRLARSAFPGRRIHTIFDVGAHVGAVSTRFRACFPDAVIHAFEPAPETFASLEAALCGQGVIVNQIALSDQIGETAFMAQGQQSINRVLPRALKPAGREKPSVISVLTSTGDSYCARVGVSSISFLKIDTEGHDLRVLKGFAGLLDAQAIDFIQVEAGMFPENRRHVPFEQLKGHLESCGYRLLRVYGQSGDRDMRVLRRADLLFVSLNLAKD